MPLSARAEAWLWRPGLACRERTTGRPVAVAARVRLPGTRVEVQNVVKHAIAYHTLSVTE